ncbi:hypothetical protein [Rhizobium leguminosarum]
MSRYDLTDFECREIEPLLPNKPRGITSDVAYPEALEALAKELAAAYSVPNE